MRVLAMVHAYPPRHNAGGEMTIHALLLALVNEGHQVEVLVSRADPKAPPIDHHDTIPVHYNLGSAGPFTWFGTARQPDVVLTHLENTSRAAALCGIYRVPLVQVLHNDHGYARGGYLRGPTHLAVFNTDWMAQAYTQFWESRSAKPLPASITIHPPVDPGPLQGIDHGQRITLINLFAEKGADLFWRLVEALPERKFLGIEGAYGEQVLPDRIPDNAVVYGHLTPGDMPKVAYGQTKILLMPSSYESYGRVAIEAAHVGIPTIAHPTPGLTEALGSAGTFVDRDDLDGWVAAIKYLNSPRGFAAASKRAKAHARSLTPETDLARFVNAVEGVVRGGFSAHAG